MEKAVPFLIGVCLKQSELFIDPTSVRFASVDDSMMMEASRLISSQT